MQIQIKVFKGLLLKIYYCKHSVSQNIFIYYQILQVHRGSNRGDRSNVPPSVVHPSAAGGGPTVAPRQRLVTTPHEILSKPWMLTEKELEVSWFYSNLVQDSYFANGNVC